MSTKWYVATAKHQSELYAAANLRDQGYGVYIPKRFWRQPDSRKAEPLCALRFTGYIFVAFDAAAEEHGPISNTRGVDDLLVNANGDPISLSAAIIDHLRELEDEEFARAISRTKSKPRTDLAPGDQVTIAERDHPAFGQKGYLVGAVKGMATVLIGMMPWKLPDLHLRKVEPAAKNAA